MAKAKPTAGGAGFRELLFDGDLRSVNGVQEVLHIIRRDQSHLTELVSLINDESLGVAVRAADALEKLSRDHPDWLNTHKQTLMTWPQIARRPEQLWMYCLIMPRLKLTQREAVSAAQSIESCLVHKSSILKTNAVQGLVELGMQFPSLRTKAESVLQGALNHGTPAMKARARKLKIRLEQAA